MKIFWPRKHAGLPPGQRLLNEMPRFTDKPFKPPPEPAPLRLTISLNNEPIAELTATTLAEFGPEDLKADFHCVTTWSVKNVVWTGIPLHRIAKSVGLDQHSAPYLVARAVDGRRGHFVSTDALAPDVMLATHLNGHKLGVRHGGPLRLVAPGHYAYKSIKHLTNVDFKGEPPTQLGKEHLRGRVALEERHPTLPNWLVKTPYRLAIPLTAYAAERSLRAAPQDSLSTTL